MPSIVHLLCKALNAELSDDCINQKYFLRLASILEACPGLNNNALGPVLAKHNLDFNDETRNHGTEISLKAFLCFVIGGDMVDEYYNPVRNDILEILIRVLLDANNPMIARLIKSEPGAVRSAEQERKSGSTEDGINVTNHDKDLVVQDNNSRDSNSIDSSFDWVGCERDSQSDDGARGLETVNVSESNLSGSSPDHGKCFSEINELYWNRGGRGLRARKPAKCCLCGNSCTIASWGVTYHPKCDAHYTDESKKRLACPQCNKVYKTANISALYGHIKMVHHAIALFTCDECGQKFGKIENLKRHRLIHLPNKPYSCEICGRGFSARYTMKTHMRQHTNEKPFMCEFCGKSFCQNVSYRYHFCQALGKRIQEPTDRKKGIGRPAKKDQQIENGAISNELMQQSENTL